ncbi:MAG: hypothetical protein ACRDTJ_33790 [Pseudonocardiaceae bacterium]
MRRHIRYSDNTAGDLLLDDLGGPARSPASPVPSATGDAARPPRAGTEQRRAQRRPGHDQPRAIAADYRERMLGFRLDDLDRALLTSWLVGNTTGDKVAMNFRPDGSHHPRPSTANGAVAIAAGELA